MQRYSLIDGNGSTDKSCGSEVEIKETGNRIEVRNYGDRTVFLSNRSGLSVENVIPATAPISEKNLLLSSMSISARHSIAIQDGYRAVQPRTQLTLGSDLLYRPTDYVTPIIPPNTREQSLIQVLENDIAEIASTAVGPICVHLSGGFDSTAILASLPQERRKDAIATTWIYPEGSANNDRIHAKRVADFYEINHVEVYIDPSKLYSVPTELSRYTWSVSNSISAVGILYDEISAIGGIKDTLFLDGHGGDHMLVDPVPASIIGHIAKRSGPIAAFKKMRQLTDLYSSNLLTVASKVFQEGDLPSKMPLSSGGHNVLLSAQPPKSAFPSFRRYRMGTVLNALTDNRTSVEPRGFRYAYPFTDGNFPAAAMQVPADDLFNDESSRAKLRKELMKKHHRSLFGRRDKGYSTGAFQIATKIKFDELDALIRNSVLAQSGLIDVDRCINELVCSSKGITGLSWAVSMIIASELTVLALRRQAP